MYRLEGGLLPCRACTFRDTECREVWSAISSLTSGSVMTDQFAFSIVVLVVAAVLIAGTFSSRLTAWLRIPAPALFLIVAAVVALFLPAFGPAARDIDERIVSVALVLILFNGGMHIGWRRFRAAAGPIAWIGIAGTAITAAALAVAAHFLLGFDWQISMLLGAALSPTD